jgi:hypothetical protein
MKRHRGSKKREDLIRVAIYLLFLGVTRSAVHLTVVAYHVVMMKIQSTWRSGAADDPGTHEL